MRGAHFLPIWDDYDGDFRQERVAKAVTNVGPVFWTCRRRRLVHSEALVPARRIWRRLNDGCRGK